MPKARKRKSRPRVSKPSRVKPTLGPSKTGCCVRMNKAYWDKKTWNWKAKPFFKIHFRSFLHIPLGFGKIFAEELPKLQKKGLITKKKTEMPLCLVRNETRWGGDMYIEVKKTDPNINSEHMGMLSGKFFSMYFEGSYRETDKWVKELIKESKKRKYRVQEILNFYCTCPKCTKAYGSAQTILFARIG